MHACKSQEISGTLDPSPLGQGVSNPLETRRFSAMLSFQIWSLLLKRLVRNHGDHPENYYPSRPALQGQSRSLGRGPTWIDRLRNIC